MHSLTLRRAPFGGVDANALLRAALGLSLFVVVTWLYWLMQLRIGL